MLDPSKCSIELENTFGPIVASSCLHGFDFTLLFEETILTLVPLGLTFLAASLRCWKLQGALEKVDRSWSYAAKEVGQSSCFRDFFLHANPLSCFGSFTRHVTWCCLPFGVIKIARRLLLR